MRRSKILLQIGGMEICLYYFRHCLSPFLWTVTTWAFSKSKGNFPSFRKSLKIIDTGLHIEFSHSFIIRILSISWPWALFGSKLFIILDVSTVEKLTVSSSLLVSFSSSFGKSLLLFNRVLKKYCKKSIKKFSFLFKVCYQSNFMKHRRYTRNFLLFRRVFKMDQYVFDLVAGLSNLLDNLE